MSRKGTYYLARVHKGGQLDDELLLKILLEPKAIAYRGNGWTIINSEEYIEDGRRFIFGQLSKYSPEAEVVIVDPGKRQEYIQKEPNLRIAFSPFIYLPEFSGLAFLYVWRDIETATFINRFCEIVEASLDHFFVECSADPISDLRSFAVKLLRLDGIYGLSANISPPNPQFGRYWKSLKEYIERRNAEKVSLEEASPGNTPLNSNLPSLVDSIANGNPLHPSVADNVAIGDAAILMAADGYGSGKVKGKVDGDFVTIRTSETIRNFTFDREPDPVKLYKTTREIFQKISEERQMQH